MLARAVRRVVQQEKWLANTRIGFALMNATATNKKDTLTQLEKMKELEPSTAPVVEKLSLLGVLSNAAKKVYEMDSRLGEGLTDSLEGPGSKRLGIHFVDTKIDRGDVYYNEHLRNFVFSAFEPSDAPLVLRASSGRVTGAEAVYMHQLCTSMTDLPSGSFVGIVGIVEPDEHHKSLCTVNFPRDNVDFYELLRPEVEGLVSLIGPELGQEGPVTIVPHCSSEQMRDIADAASMACAAEHTVAAVILKTLGIPEAQIESLGIMECTQLCGDEVANTFADISSAVQSTRAAFSDEFTVPLFAVPIERVFAGYERCARKEARIQLKNHAFQLGFALTLYQVSGLEPSTPFLKEVLAVAEKEKGALHPFQYTETVLPEHRERMAKIEAESKRRAALAQK